MSKQLEWEKIFKEKVILPDTWVWWYNPINKDSLRLTTPAFRTISKHLKFYNIKPVSGLLYPKTLLQMERYFKEPYFITNQSVYLHSEQDAIMLALHANDLQQYLDNLMNNS